MVVASAEVAASLVWGVFEPELQGTLGCMTHMSALSKKLVSPERHDECHGEHGSDKAANDRAGVVTRRQRQSRFAVITIASLIRRPPLQSLMSPID